MKKLILIVALFVAACSKDDDKKDNPVTIVGSWNASNSNYDIAKFKFEQSGKYYYAVKGNTAQWWSGDYKFENNKLYTRLIDVNGAQVYDTMGCVISGDKMTLQDGTEVRIYARP